MLVIMLKIYLLKLKEEDKFSSVETFLPFISKEKQKRLISLKSDRQQIITIVGELLIKYALCRETHIAMSELKISYGDLGKPLCYQSELYFNLSHTGDYIAVVVSDYPVGIDIEKIKNVNKRIAKRFFSKAENEFLDDSPVDEYKYNFFKVWTAKESYVKAVGTGIDADFAKFSSFGHELGEGNIINENGLLAKYVHYQLAEDYLLCITTLC